MNQLKDEMSALQHEVLQLKQCHRNDAAKIPTDEEFPSLLPQQRINTNQLQDAATGVVNKQFAEHVKDLRQTGLVRNAAHRSVRKPVYGSSESSRLKCVQTVRSVGIFLSRLHPETKNAEIIECVNDVKGDLRVQDVTCNQLSSRYAEL